MSKSTFNSAVVSVEGTASVEAVQRDFATNRVKMILSDLKARLSEQFNMNAQSPPSTARDLIKAITEGDYVLDENKLDEHADELHYYNSFFGIKWGKNKPDRVGFDAARKVLDEKGQEVIDTVTLGSIEEARQAIADFKKWTYKAK